MEYKILEEDGSEIRLDFPGWYAENVCFTVQDNADSLADYLQSDTDNVFSESLGNRDAKPFWIEDYGLKLAV